MIIFIGLIYLTIGIVVLVGITLHDIRETAWLRSYRRHPHAKRYRERPMIFIDSQKISSAQLMSLRKSYRKLTLTTASKYIFILETPPAFSKDALKNAIMRLNSQPSLGSYEISPALAPAETLPQLFENYRHIANDLFRKSRSGLGIYTPTSVSVIQKSHIQRTSRDKLYTLLATAAKLPLPLLLIWVAYMGIVVGISEVLLATLQSFGLFMIAALWWHDQLTLRQKISYALLLPITIWYFAGLSIEQSLKILAHMGEAIFHGSIGLFVRIKDVLRIVE